MANWGRVTRRIARRHRIDPEVFDRQMSHESVGYDEDVISGRRSSPAGAQGIAQIMPATARSWGVNPLKPRKALNAAAKHMREYLDSYGGDYRKALAAYNAGPGAVAKYGGVPPYAETQNYVKQILAGKPAKERPGQSRAAAQSFRPLSVKTGEQTSFDQAGYEKARKASIVGGLIARRRGTDSPLFKTGLLTTDAPDPAAFVNTQLTSKLVKGAKTDFGSGLVAATSGRGGGGPVLANTARRTAGQMLNLALKADRLNRKGKLDYRLGGGHGSTPARIGELVDCSGFVSQLLGISPRVSGQYESWGKPGPGKFATVYANEGHVLMSIRDPKTGKKRWFGTSRSNPGGGAGEISPPSKEYLDTFEARHPGRAGGKRRRR